MSRNHVCDRERRQEIVYRKPDDARVALDFEVWAIWRKDERNPVVLDLISGL